MLAGKSLLHPWCNIKGITHICDTITMFLKFSILSVEITFSSSMIMLAQVSISTRLGSITVGISFGQNLALALGNVSIGLNDYKHLEV